MFEPAGGFSVKTGAAFLSRNLSVFYHKTKGQTYAAYLGKDAVQMMSWDDSLEQNSCDLIGLEEIMRNAGPSGEKPVSLMQVYVCLPTSRNVPVVVLLATTFVSIIDFKTHKRLLTQPTADILSQTGANKRTLKATPFSRGISCVENLIIAGCNSGEIVQILCAGEGNFQAKKSFKEHVQPIVDIATCIFDLITVSGDVAGNLLVWSKNMKSVMKRISTNQQLNVLNILRKQIFCGNLLGQICVYSALNGALLSEMNAHSRQITAISVATESAYLLTASEDTYVRIWKLHSRNPDAYKVEFRYAQRFENMPIIGASFANTRGSGYLITSYENFNLLHYKITRRPSPNPAGGPEDGEVAKAKDVPKTCRTALFPRPPELLCICLPIITPPSVHFNQCLWWNANRANVSKREPWAHFGEKCRKFLKMSTDGEEIAGENEQTNKAQLVRTINQLLLQNGLPVTAAALRKECEKLWSKNGAKTTRTWWTIAEHEANGTLLALAEGNAIAASHSETEDTTIANWTMRPKPAKSVDSIPQQLLPLASTITTSSNRRQLTSKTNATKVTSPRRSVATTAVEALEVQLPRQSRQPSTNRSIDKDRSSTRSRSVRRLINNPQQKQQQRPSPVLQSRRSRSNTDTEEESGTELLRKKADSTSNLSQSPPADPVRARPGEHNVPRTDQHELEMNTKKSVGAEQWICTHLDYTAVGIALLKGAPSRDNALLVQALRQQLTKAGSLAVGGANLNAMIANDVLQLRDQKQSVLSLLLCPQQSSAHPSVDRRAHLNHSNSSSSLIASSSTGLPSSMPTFVDLVKDQLGRLLNAFASFRCGRDYLLSGSQGRQLLYETALALRTKRVGGPTVEHLVAALQKMSIRQFVQKELVLNGMLEWLCRWLAQPRQSLNALEFGTSLLHNLCLCPFCHQTALRHKDELLATVLLLIGQAKSSQLLNYACGTLFALLTLPRVRGSARERGDAERTLHERMHRNNAIGSSGCVKPTEQQRQQLAALLHMLRGGGGVELTSSSLTDNTKKRIASLGCFGDKAEEEEQTFPDYLEAEIDSTDPLVPSLNELFGHALLSHRFLLPGVECPPATAIVPSRQRIGQVQFAHIEDDRESIPGVVPAPRARLRPAAAHHAARQRPADAQAQQRKPRTARISPAIDRTLPSREKDIDTEGSPLARISMHFERSNSMTSHSTFVVENNARRPLLVASDFASMVALTRNVGGGRWHRMHQQRKRTGPMTSFDNLEGSSPEALVVVEEFSSNGKEGNSRETAGPVKSRERSNKMATSGKGLGGTTPMTANTTKMFSSKLGRKVQRGKWPRGEVNNGEHQMGTSGARTENDGDEPTEEGETTYPSYDECMSAFAARPKVIRTPPEQNGEILQN
uniref:WD_REPEATS_REGION domain-containing protein n=1 Tax=Globodera rostochiensis TaxID=31243 RepID=A0A914HF92_GLORO